NWTSIEEEHFAVSYITVGEEPNWSNNQSGSKFCKSVTEDFKCKVNVKILKREPNLILW
ncbi:hypothetical protein CROQUDRAFT_23853, partial [Cronartium quercuum f. sp. fusiforme G11]